MGADGCTVRRMEVVVDGYVAGHDDVDDEMDALGAAIERAMSMPSPAEDAGLDLRSVRLDVHPRGDAVIGVVRHEYECRVQGAPDPEMSV
jgi:hypothetical protein